MSNEGKYAKNIDSIMGTERSTSKPRDIELTDGGAVYVHIENPSEVGGGLTQAKTTVAINEAAITADISAIKSSVDGVKTVLSTSNSLLGDGNSLLTGIGTLITATNTAISGLNTFIQETIYARLNSIKNYVLGGIVDPREEQLTSAGTFTLTTSMRNCSINVSGTGSFTMEVKNAAGTLVTRTYTTGFSTGDKFMAYDSVITWVSGTIIINYDAKVSV